ncbi:hypothetical protein QZH41_014686 [Actinostola sp. cb2023]|nr:hypothetical protein QZH41_014686 [Actinostola sp. cb2023]
MENGKIKDSQITASSYHDDTVAPSNARLHMKSVQGEHGGVWAAETNRNPQWVQIDLGAVKKVTAIAIQGHPDRQMWIKTYQILYGDDPNSLTLYGNEKIFIGNTDSNSVVKNILNPPIEAKYIRVLVKSWHRWPSMRIELYRCIEESAAKCGQNPLGMESGTIKDSQITASSYDGNTFAPWNARLQRKSVQGEHGGGWIAETNRGPQWVQIDLGTVKKVTAIATQGHPDEDVWTKTYQILSGNDPNSLTLYDNGKIFTGNTDSNTVVKNILNPPIEASYIRVLVKNWHYWLSMRIELYGCIEGNWHLFQKPYFAFKATRVKSRPK